MWLILFICSAIGCVVATRLQTMFGQNASIAIRSNIRKKLLLLWRQQSPLSSHFSSPAATQWVENIKAMDGYFSKCFILLDELTAKLDLSSKEYIYSALNKLKSNAIVVVVTHDLALLDIADVNLGINQREGLKVRYWFGLLYKTQRNCIFNGVLLAFITTFSGVSLLMLSGWFITATALAGLSISAGLIIVFDMYMPGSGIRFFALSRTVGRYVKRRYNYDIIQRLH
ncbi:MAG: hypothetical protein ACI9LE_002083 [Paraglaciecola sp.]